MGPAATFVLAIPMVVITKPDDEGHIPTLGERLTEVICENQSVRLSLWLYPTTIPIEVHAKRPVTRLNIP